MHWKSENKRLCHESMYKYNVMVLRRTIRRCYWAWRNTYITPPNTSTHQWLQGDTIVTWFVYLVRKDNTMQQDGADCRGYMKRLHSNSIRTAFRIWLNIVFEEISWFIVVNVPQFTRQSLVVAASSPACTECKIYLLSNNNTAIIVPKQQFCVALTIIWIVISKIINRDPTLHKWISLF